MGNGRSPRRLIGLVEVRRRESPRRAAWRDRRAGDALGDEAGNGGWRPGVSPLHACAPASVASNANEPAVIPFGMNLPNCGSVRYFVAVAESCISGARPRLEHLAPPLSCAIRALEERLGVAPSRAAAGAGAHPGGCTLPRRPRARDRPAGARRARAARPWLRASRAGCASASFPCRLRRAAGLLKAHRSARPRAHAGAA